MGVISVPFDKGQHEEVDAKLLPQGLFTQMVNVRYPKAARVAFRKAYVYDSSISSSYLPNTIASQAVGSAATLSLIQRTSPGNPPKYVAHYGSANKELGVAGGVSTSGGDIGVFIRQVINNKYNSSGVTVEYTGGVAATLNTSYPASVDLTLLNSTLYMAASTYLVATTDGYGMSFDYQYPGGDIATLGLDANSRNIKLVTIGGQVCIFYANTATGQIRMSVWGSLSSTTVVTASGGGVRAAYFDVCPGANSNEAYLVYPNSTTQLTFGTVNSSGVFSSLNTIAIGSAEARCSISPTFNAPTDQIVIAWNEGATFTTGILRYAVYRRSTVSFITSATTIYSTHPMVGYPVVGQHPTLNWAICASTSETVAGFTFNLTHTVLFRGIDSIPSICFNVSPVSRPFATSLNGYVMVVDKDQDTTGPASYYAIDLGFPFRFETAFAVGAAKIADTTNHDSDPRRSVLTTVPVVGTAPGLSAVVAALPLNNGLGIWRCEFGPRGDNGSFAQLNGQTFMGGARVVNFDGVNVTNDNFESFPQIQAIDLGVGLMGAGTYQYVATWEYVDSLGYRHISAPSLPATITIAANHNVEIGIVPPVDLTKNIFGATAHVYRTENGLTVFHHVGSTNLPLNASLAGFIDSNTDAQIAANAALYTQGARGGLSGLHENNAPPAAKYLWAGSDRLFAGGLESPNEVQWSKLRFDGEPIAWADDAEWKANVDQPVTAVAEMDGIWVIFTRDAIWTVSGQGPDDTGAGGFDVPRRLPSDIGCISARSLRLTGQGLYFQGASDRMYLLPRGGGEPKWVGQPIRDTLTSFPFVSASAFDEDSGRVYWAVCDSVASAGRLLVLDTRTNEWAVDNFFGRAIKALSIYNGLLVIDGAIIESTTSYQDNDGSSTASVVPMITTGDIRAFGMAGWGRYRKVQVLGEVRDVSVAWTLTMDVSYDSGKTWTTEGQWTRANLGAVLGDAFDQAEHLFWTQKSDTIRLRFSISTPSATEGFVLNGLTLEVYGAPGTKRNPNSLRAA